MTFSYSADFAATPTGRRNRVRFVLGDVDEAVKQTNRRLEDEEIDAVLTRWGSNVDGAVLECGEALLARWVRREVGTVKGEMSEKVRMLTAVLDRLRGLVGAVPQATGVSVSDKAATAENTDLPQPSFFRGMMDNPEAIDPQPDDETDS